MTPDELLHLIAKGEGQRLEFKRSLAELEDSVCTIAAFANAEGGTLLFGVRADGTVIGVTLGANTREQVVNVMHIAWVTSSNLVLSVPKGRHGHRAHEARHAGPRPARTP